MVPTRGVHHFKGDGSSLKEDVPWRSDGVSRRRAVRTAGDGLLPEVPAQEQLERLVDMRRAGQELQLHEVHRPAPLCDATALVWCLLACP